MEKFCRKGHLIKSGKRWLSVLLCVCMIGTMIPVTARAENGTTNSGLCEHHAEHTAECGYVAPTEGHACEHVHDESCGYQEACECNHVHTEECGENGESCTHEHTSECGYVEGHACDHKHDEECGYVEASEGSPCTFVCDICGKEAEPEQTEGKLITTWQWIDEDEYLDEETSNLALPGASKEMPAHFDDVVGFLPTQIQATAENTEDTEAEAVNETITLGDWACEDYPETGAYTGSYTFTAALPEGYALSEEAEALMVLVELGGAQMYGTVASISYLDRDGITQTCESATEVTIEDTEWGTSDTDTWYVVNSDVTIGQSGSNYQRVSVNGNVHLILTDGYTLTVYGGIGVNEGSSLTIYGQTYGNGKLIANANNSQANGCAGIGGDSGKSGGTITINGGNITALGRTYGAGIGGGEGGTGGTITINGGTVTATGGTKGGAGIGGGEWGDGGSITINGGTITATASSLDGGAGIGGGLYAGGGNITIKGGTVKATGGSYGGAGIGGGSGGSSACGNGGNITISGGTITATGGTKGGAGIGGGGYTDQTGGSGGSIIISGGTVTATGGTNGGAGIGDGNNGSDGTVAISNSFVMAGSISDTVSQSSWNGIIFVGEDSKVYGDSVNISTDCTIPSEKSLVVAAEQTISIAETATFTNEGTIYNSGTFTGTVANSGTIHNAGSISGASGDTINHYSISIEQTGTSCQSAPLTLKVNDTAFGESVTYTLSDGEANAVIENGNTLKVTENGGGTPIPVTATFTVDGVSMTRTEDVTITGHAYGNNGFCTECDAYQPATFNETNNRYEIGNAGQLYWFADKVNSGETGINAVLTADITINEKVLVNGELSGDADSFRSWTPIGYYNSSSDCKCYTGTFDGKNYTINGLYYKNDTANYVGLFSYVSGGKVLNVSIEDSFIRGYEYVGGVCGYLKNGTIKNCHNKGKVGGVYYYIGGVCGYLDNRGIIEDCHNEGAVSAIETKSSQYIGGVCGKVTLFSTIKGCYNKGTVGGEGTRYYIGGVCGRVEAYSTIQNCYNEGKVSGNTDIGGIVGNSDDSTIENCYNVGEVSGNSYTGGVSGTNTASYINCFYDKNKCNVGGLEGTDETGKAEGKTTTEFASGLVCYLLNGSTSENLVWYQNIDNGTADTYPILDSTHGTVYQSTPCPIEYSNTLGKTVAHIFHADENESTKHTCEKCDYSEAHSTTNLTYSADEKTNRITVYCNEGGCGTNIGYVELAAPSGTITYDGIKKEATVSDTVDGVDFSTTPITYKQGETALISAPKDAGTYTASITLGTGAATVSVEFTIGKATPTISWGKLSGATWVEMTEIPVTYTGSEIAPNKLVPSLTVTLVNNETYSGEISYSYRVQGSSDAFTSGLPTEIGTYEVKASIAADGNYKEAASTVTLTVNWLNILHSATLTDQGGIELTGDTWWAQSVTFTAPTGFTISNSLTDSFGTSFVYNEQTGADGTEVIYYLKNSAGEIAKKTALVRIDKTAPDWSGENDGISIKTNKWKSLLSTISFGLFYKETVDVKVCASDSLSGMAAYYYYVDSTGGTVKTAAELDALNFTEYTEGVSGQNPTVTVTSLAPDGNYIVYAYAVDATGNRSAYVCSEGVVVDSTAPAISNIVAPSQGTPELTDTTAQISFTGSEAGTYFYMVKESSENAPTTITDFATSDADSKGMTTWTANPNVSSASMKADADNKITLSDLKAYTEYTLYLAAVDLAGNSIQTIESKSFTTCRTIPTVAAADMPKISGTYGQKVENMTLTDGVAKVGSNVITGTWEVTDSNKTDVPAVGTTATYQVTFTPDESYNGMYDTVDVQVTPTVAKKTVTVTADDKTKKYSEDNPVLTFSVPDGTLVGTDREDALDVILNCEATKTSPVKVGGYAITGTSSSANYDVTVTPGTLTIEKADATITVGTDTYNKTFGDEAFTLSDVTDTNTEANVQYAVTAGDGVVSVSNGTVTILKAGTATITVSLPASTNYNAAANQTITVNVSKKSGYTVDAINRSYFYVKDSADTIDLSTTLPDDCGNVTYGTPQVSGELYASNGQPAVSSDGKLSYTVKQAGTYGDSGTIKVTVTTESYADFTITVNVELIDQLTISLKNGSSVTLQNSTLTYGEALSKLAFNSAVFVDNDGHEVTGTLAWKTPTATPNAGTTSATWVFTPDDNAYATVEDIVAITVNKATPDVTALPTVADRTYAPAVSLADADLVGGTVTGADGNSLDGVWSWQTANIIPTVDNSGYEAVFTPTDTTNYHTVTRTIAVAVSQATPVLGDVTVTPGSVNNTTDITKVTLARADETVPGVLKLDAEALSYASNTYGWTFTPTDTTNYKTVTGSVIITVNDTIAPTAEYQIGENGWKKFVNTVSFGLFCKDYKTVEITYRDVNESGETGSGVKTGQYYIAEKELTEAELADAQWTDYSGTISLNAKGVYFIYVKVEDNAGNKVVLNSEGIVIYGESILSPTSLDYTYKENNDLEVQIAMNGNTFGKLTDGAGTEIAADNYTIDASGRLTLKAAYLDTLKVGEYTYKVYMNPQGQTTNTVTLAYSFVVKVKACELTVTGATATDRVYDTTNVVAITAVELSGVKNGDDVSVAISDLTGTLSGATSGDYTSVTLPTLTLTGADAGNYTLTQPTGAVPTDVTISKADAEITVGAVSYDKTFGDAEFTLDVTDTNAEADVKYEVTSGADVVSVSNGSVTILKAGSAAITVSLPASTNYNAAEDKMITVNVAKKSGYAVDEVNRSYFYVKNSADTVDFSAMLPADCGNVTYGTPRVTGDLYTENGQPAVSGEGQLSYTVKQAETYGAAGTIQVTVTTDNYADFTITVNVELIDQLTVSLKEGSSVTLQNSTLTYGEALSKLAFNSIVFVDDDGHEVTGTLAWKTPDVIANAGTTSATWVFTPEDNAYATVEDIVAITVNKATPDVTALPTVADRTYAPAVSLADADLVGGTVTGADGNSLDGVWSWQTANIIPTVDNTGYVAVFTPEDTTNYETVTGTVTVTVSKATPYIATVPTAAVITYGDTLGASTLSGGTVQYSGSDGTTVAGSFAWKDNAVKPSVADSNNTTYRAVFTPSDADNYNTVETDITLTVNKAENAPNMPSSTMNVANSCTKVSDVTLPTDWVWQDAEKDKALVADMPVTATAVYDGADKGNYVNETVSVTITRSACEHAHTEIRGAQTATCTADGYTGDTYCIHCGVRINTGTATFAPGHNYTSRVTTKPTTEMEGVMTYTCDRCGHSYTRAIDKLQDTNDNNPGENLPENNKPANNKPADNKPVENNAGENQQPKDNMQDTGMPYIKDEIGMEGWDVIKDEVDKTQDGADVVVEMNGSSVVPGDVLDEIKGKDVTIVFDMGGGITWSVNGQRITGDKTSDIDFSVSVGTNTIPVDVIDNVTGERKSQQISLAYDGEFGFTAVLSINMGASNAGLYANLFYYNEKMGELEFICADEIAEDGNTELTFTHASEYAIVIDKEPMDGSAQVTGPASESQTTEAEVTQTGAEVKGDAWNPWWITVIGIMVIVIGLGVFLVAKKMKEEEQK